MSQPTTPQFKRLKSHAPVAAPQQQETDDDLFLLLEGPSDAAAAAAAANGTQVKPKIDAKRVLANCLRIEAEYRVRKRTIR